VLQLEKVSRALLADLARRAPLLPGRDTVAFLHPVSQYQPHDHEPDKPRDTSAAGNPRPENDQDHYELTGATKAYVKSHTVD
jgi:hypothetical protein